MLNVEFSDEEEDTASNEPFAHLVRFIALGVFLP